MDSVLLKADRGAAPSLVPGGDAYHFQGSVRLQDMEPRTVTFYPPTASARDNFLQRYP
jgi:hypothetical protein